MQEYGREAILDIEDISDFVAEQRVHVAGGNYDELVTPVERVYKPTDTAVAARLRLSN